VVTEWPFSVLLSVYEENQPDHLRIALESVLNQTVAPAEVVVMADGPLPDELDEVIESFRRQHADTFQRVSLSENRGLGKALQVSVESCSHELVARMDADDVAVPDRFETQLEYLESNPEVDVIGGYVAEFDSDPADPDRIRKVPTGPENVREFAKVRCPTNHPTVMFRRDAVLSAGNYGSWRSMQDYELWMRMLTQGYVIDNVPTVLVNCRADSTLYRRRGGLKYIRLEVTLQRKFHRMGAISSSRFVSNLLVRVSVRAIPNQIREALYKRFLRRKNG